MGYKNFCHRLEKIKNLLKLRRQRDLSLKGKITVLKALAMSQLIYPLTMLFTPQWVVEEANKLFYAFLWDGKPDKVKRTTIIRQIADGGLKMIDVESMAKALKLSWIKKLYNETDRKWTVIPRLYFKQLNFNDICKSNFNESCLPRMLPKCYNLCMLSYAQEEINELLNESLWLNRNI